MATKTKVSKKLSKPEKITNEELNKIQNLIDSANGVQMQVGKIAVQKHFMLSQIHVIQNQITSFREELKKNYGTDDVNIETGEINYNKNEQADKKD